MSEDNEKRIFIREVENPCADCENKGCNVCHCGEIWKAAIPRTDAVDRMTPAIYKALNTGISFDHPRKQIYKEMAQAALDALLGGKQ